MGGTLNYHHLYYFWTVAREGTVTAASEALGLAPSTISAQIHQLEDACGRKLFERAGRRLVLTEVGKMTYQYADEIFSLGHELWSALQERPEVKPRRLRVGVASGVSALLVGRLLRPLLEGDEEPETVRLSCVEGESSALVSELAGQALDVILDDRTLPGGVVSLRAKSRELGSCQLGIFGSQELATHHGGDFPNSLSGAPFLLLTDHATSRRSLEHWMRRKHIHPRIVGEFQSGALLELQGQAGAGLFAAPMVVREELRERYGVVCLGEIPVEEKLYAIHEASRKDDPLLEALASSARSEFGAMAVAAS